MSALTIRFSDEKYERLKVVAKQKHLSVGKLIEEFSGLLLAQFDAETRFRLRVSKASKKTGLQLLEKLDRHFAED